MIKYRQLSNYNLKTFNFYYYLKMFEAKLSEGAVLKKIVESIKDIVTDVNIDISPSGKYH